jgi:anaerobic selenocysteine-containing dehydrogenase
VIGKAGLGTPHMDGNAGLDVGVAVDRGWVDAHTIGFDELAATVDPYTPERAAEICRVPAVDVRRAAEIFETSRRVLSTVLQGFYQSHQATAAACQVNNLHLLRGLIGRPGCGILQMNGQPTAQNTRECGADGDRPVSATGTTPRTSTSWRDCGTWIRW